MRRTCPVGHAHASRELERRGPQQLDAPLGMRVDEREGFGMQREPSGSAAVQSIADDRRGDPERVGRVEA